MEEMIDTCARCVALSGMVPLLLAGFMAASLCAELRREEPSRGMIAFKAVVLLSVLAWAFIAIGNRLHPGGTAVCFPCGVTFKVFFANLVLAGAAGWILSRVSDYRWRDLKGRRLVVFLGVLVAVALLLWIAVLATGWILG